MSHLPAFRLDAAYAAIDLGTNNCRMLVARPHGRGFRVVDAFSRITRLGEGVATDGFLREAAMIRTIAALRQCAAKIRKNGVTETRLVATEACRRASNAADFACRVFEETGLSLEIISAEEESHLALAGVTSLMDPARPYGLMFDIGGGSTELVWVEQSQSGPKVVGLQSLPLGVVTLAEEMGNALNDSLVFEQTVQDIMAQLDGFGRRYAISEKLSKGQMQMLGTSGTVTTLTALHLGLDKYDRQKVDGAVMEMADIVHTVRALHAMSPADRAGNNCIGPERADLVMAGCVILKGLCRLWPTDSIRVADRGVREGILMSMMNLNTSRQSALAAV